MRKRIFKHPEIEMNSRPKLPRMDVPQIELTAEGSTPPPLHYCTEVLETEVSEDPFIKFLEYWHIVCRHKIAVLVLTLLGVVGGGVYNLCLVPKYQAKASLEIQGSQDAISSVNFASFGNSSLQTQIDILKSRPLLNATASKMVMTSYSEPQTEGDYLAHWRKVLGIQPKWGQGAWQEAVARAKSTMRITSTRDSSIISLQCESTNPQVASEFINGLAREYIQQRMDQRWEAYQSTSKWLNQAQMELKSKLEASEQELQRFAHTSGLLFTSDTQNVSEAKLTQLQAELSRAQALRIAKEAEYEASKSSKPEALPEVLDSGPIRSYQVQLTELRRQLAEFGSALTPEHYKIKRIEAQIEELESVSARERGNIIKRIRNEYDAALRTENQIRAEYDRQIRLISGEAEDLIHYRILKREADTNRTLYELTLQKGKEASIASALRASDARVTDPATPAGMPTSPMLWMNLTAGLLGGLALGAGLVIARDHVHATVHVTGSLPLSLGVRELGVIPSAKIDRLSYGGSKRSISAGHSTRNLLSSGQLMLNAPIQDGRGMKSNGGIELMTWNESNSVIAEAFRATMASILFSAENNTGKPQVIVFTSPSPKAGKTTTISNIAIALAEINQRVLLVDGDMRLPRIHNIFNIANNWGLSNALHEQTPIEEYSEAQLSQKTDIPNLSVMPSGSARTNYSRLLYSPRLFELLGRFRCFYSVVLIDAPPVLNVPDARILSRAADSAVLVFRAPNTTRDEAGAAMRCFEEDGTPVLGTILNDWNPAVSGYGKYGRYGAYRSPYAYRYDANAKQ